MEKYRSVSCPTFQCGQQQQPINHTDFSHNKHTRRHCFLWAAMQNHKSIKFCSASFFSSSQSCSLPSVRTGFIWTRVPLIVPLPKVLILTVTPTCWLANCSSTALLLAGISPLCLFNFLTPSPCVRVCSLCAVAAGHHPTRCRSLSWCITSLPPHSGEQPAASKPSLIRPALLSEHNVFALPPNTTVLFPAPLTLCDLYPSVHLCRCWRCARFFSQSTDAPAQTRVVWGATAGGEIDRGTS